MGRRTGAITLFLEGTGRANGMAFDRDGNLIACADMHGELWKIYPDGTHDVLVNNYGGKLLNGPNDVWINPVNGGMYITDPMFPRPYWDDADPRKQAGNRRTRNRRQWARRLRLLPPARRQRVGEGDDGGHGWVSDAWPNGVVGTPDGKKLYVNKWYYDNKAEPGSSISILTARSPT
jgi:gluconolactonase